MLGKGEGEREVVWNQADDESESRSNECVVRKEFVRISRSALCGVSVL